MPFNVAGVVAMKTFSPSSHRQFSRVGGKYFGIGSVGCDRLLAIEMLARKGLFFLKNNH
jgi:hypothetical protein